MSIVASGPPFKVLSVVTSIDEATGNFHIAWTAPVINGASIIKYLIELRDSSNAWKTSLTTCDGQQLAVLGTRQCSIPMQTLTGPDFGLTFGTLVQVRVTPTNNKGTGPTSDLLTSGATIRTVPLSPLAPTRGINTNEYQIQVDWLPLVAANERGGTTILGYKLYWDAGTGTTDVVVVEGMVFTYTLVGLAQHQPYRFKLQAKNIYGYGAFSSETVITTTDIPSIMDPLVVSYDANQDVVVTWTEPNTGGQPILSYDIRIFIPLTKTFVVDPNCIGSDPAMRQCTFGMSYLVSTYGFVYNELIQAIGKSTNMHGSSEYSPVNVVGPIALTKPTFMFPVTEGSNTVKDSIELLWDPIVQLHHTGGVPILSYIIDWDQGGSSWT